jgi:hypothetical protein
VLNEVTFGEAPEGRSNRPLLDISTRFHGDLAWGKPLAGMVDENRQDGVFDRACLDNWRAPFAERTEVSRHERHFRPKSINCTHMYGFYSLSIVGEFRGTGQGHQTQPAEN